MSYLDVLKNGLAKIDNRDYEILKHGYFSEFAPKAVAAKVGMTRESILIYFRKLNRQGYLSKRMIRSMYGDRAINKYHITTKGLDFLKLCGDVK